MLDRGSLIPRNPLCFRAAILDEQSINVQRVKTILLFFQHTNLKPALITFIYDHTPRDLTSCIPNWKVDKILYQFAAYRIFRQILNSIQARWSEHLNEHTIRSRYLYQRMLSK